MATPVGELAALGTAACWTASSLAFAAAAQRLGSLTLNLIRLVMALGFLTLTCWIRRGLALPVDAAPEAWGWLSVSGLVGFVLGDLCLFRAFVLLGPRLSTLIMSLVPPVAAALGWAWLGESLGAVDLAGMAVTLAGVAWAVIERQPAQAGGEPARRPSMLGIGLAGLGAVGQGVGLVISKVGMGSYDPFAATQIRVLVGIAGYALIFTAIRWWGRVFAALPDRRGLALATLGSFCGPFLGVSMSLVAVQRTHTGVAATLMSITPVMIIPAVMALHRERVSARAALGAAVAVAGVALLWLR